MRISRRRAKRLRRWIAENRCPIRPGFTHRWANEDHLDGGSWTSVTTFAVCQKCGDSK